MNVVKKMVLTAALIAAGAVTAHAHDFWVQGNAVDAGKPLQVEIGFGHAFGTTTPLPEDMVDRFNPVDVVGAGGKLELGPGASNQVRISKKEAEKGSYYVLGSMQTAVFTRGTSGFSQKYKNEVEGAQACNEFSMFAKGLITVGGTENLDFIKKPQGQKIEIVPQVLPSSVKPGQPMPLLVLFDGAPLAFADVSAVFGGFSPDDENAAAFSSKTNKQGIVNFIPLTGGLWKVKVMHKIPYTDPARCDFSNYVGSVTFRIEK